MPDTDTRSLVDYLRYWSTDKTFAFNYPTLTRRIGEAATALEQAQEDLADAKAHWGDQKTHYEKSLESQLEEAQQANARLLRDKEQIIEERERARKAHESAEWREAKLIRDCAALEAELRASGEREEQLRARLASWSETDDPWLIKQELTFMLSEGPNRDPRAATEEQP